MYTKPLTTPEDIRLSRSWTAHLLADPANLPISFRYGEAEQGQLRKEQEQLRQLIRGLPAGWNPVAHEHRIDANILEKTFEACDPQTGLQVRVECLEYRDFPVVEWTAWLTNSGSQTTPLIGDLQALDAEFAGENPVLYHCNGDFYSESGYTSEETLLAKGEVLAYTPHGGRPCDQAFPYYRMTFQGCGLTLAIGWPAQWAVQFSGLPGGVHVRAGQERVQLRLLPGETIRTPRITLMSWTGETPRAVNLWRRWYLAHVLPRPDGQPMKPALAVCAPEEGEEFTASTEQNQLRDIAKFRRLGFDFDVWWIDAGWYPCYNENHERRWWNTGTWMPDPERYPNGLKPVSDFALSQGASLLVWFEPERVRPGTQLAQEHPDWLLRSSKEDNSLLNLGDPQVRRWLTDHVDGLIKANGIKIYRQDFNFEPLDHWHSNDAADRQGMNENLHVQGYLQYWDDLLKRNPGLWIDSCSSGGRRNDLETMRRSVPLHYTDYGYGIHPIKLAFHHTLYEWIPYFKEATLSWDLHGVERFDRVLDSFSFHCGMAAMLFVTLDIRRDDYDFDLALKMIEVWRKAVDLLLHGDYYPLTPPRRSADQWVAWQFDRPETGTGFVQAFRLQECPQEVFKVAPQGFAAEARYRFQNPETGETFDVDGKAVMEDGLELKLPPRSAVIWLYQELPG
jgi:alpha-galactosidase